MKAKELIDQLNHGGLDEKLSVLYGADADVLDTQRRRNVEAIERFTKIFPDREDVHLFSAPGRTEIGGNHTDHQRGCALGAAVNLDVIAVVAFHDEGVIRRHELTVPEKEDDRTRHILVTKAQTGPVFLAFEKTKLYKNFSV